MKKALTIVLTLVMAAALLICPAMAAGGNGGGGGTGGGNNPLNVVSVTIDGTDLAGAEVAAEGRIVVVFDRGMNEHSDATAAAISIKGADSSVSFDGDRTFTVSFRGLDAGDYTLVIGQAAQANNGNTLSADYKVKFSVAAQEEQGGDETPDVPGSEDTEETPETPDVSGDDDTTEVPEVPADTKAPQTGEGIALYVIAAFAVAGAAYAVVGMKKSEG